jgi:hypothetical protein
MSTLKRTKLNNLLAEQPKGIVLLVSWLGTQGYTPDLLRKYRQSNWFESIGTNALIRRGDDVGYEGAVYALQHQAGLSIHPSGKTALSLLGKAHYLPLATKRVSLMGHQGERLPSWFLQHKWHVDVDYFTTSSLPAHDGLTTIEIDGFSIRISSAPRAMLECLLLSKNSADFVECYQLMEGLNNLKPSAVQELLEKCTSIKVKRLFLFMADKAGHEWLGHLDMEKVNLGSGKRSLVQDGAYNSKYQITIPRELETHGRAVL